MNQDQVKEILLSLRPAKVDFHVVFSGKKCQRVNGYYRPALYEITIHNGNFKSDNDLIFTAIHEYAHHIHITEEGGLASTRAPHTTKFWATFHSLLTVAEKIGIYKNPAKTNSFADTTARLKDLVAESGKIMCEIGKALLEAAKLCDENGARFDDYVMRTLKGTMPWAKACIAAAGGNLPESLGAENLKTVVAIKDPNERDAVIEGLEGDMSPQQISDARHSSEDPKDAIEALEKESARIEKTIEKLQERQEEILRALDELKMENGDEYED